ncbi:MAG: Transcriptional repressor NrdR [Phycisphaerae bacterium]|nr:Transcriptional repressor NrdR [Phycisphaerae bacterium]
MQCPFCKANDDRVIDSRSTDADRCVRRRRECLACGRRFTTYERAETAVRLSVIKRDGSRVPYERSKLEESVRRSAYKRPISAERLEQVVDEIEERIFASHEREVTSQVIGERVSEVLRRVDKVAYVRFASVYRQFEDVGDFIDEARDVLERADEDVPGQQPLFGAEGQT